MVYMRKFPFKSGFNKKQEILRQEMLSPIAYLAYISMQAQILEFEGDTTMDNITKVILAAHTLDKIEKNMGIKSDTTYMGSLPWGKITAAAGLGILNGAIRSAKRGSRYSSRKRHRRHL